MGTTYLMTRKSKQEPDLSAQKKKPIQLRSMLNFRSHHCWLTEEAITKSCLDDPHEVDNITIDGEWYIIDNRTPKKRMENARSTTTFDSEPTLLRKNKRKSASNHTGIPDTMKSRYEHYSGLSFDDVKVHYNSEKPTKLQALAYTQMNQVYLGPGQEQHLGHELAHVIQQKQGLVQPNIVYKGEHINTNAGLETGADLLAGLLRLCLPEDDTFPVLRKSPVSGNRPTKQMRWIRSRISKTAFWMGDDPPTQEEIDYIESEGFEVVAAPNRNPPPKNHVGSFLQKGGEQRIAAFDGQTKILKGEGFPMTEANDITSYFHDELQVFHKGPGITHQSTGAVFPIPEYTAPTPVHTSNPTTHWQQNVHPPHKKERLSEKKIVGQSANELMEKAGMQPWPGSSLAHLHPDHQHPTNRTDPRNRTPTTFQANQRHSAHESAATKLQQSIGSFKVERNLLDPIQNTGLYTTAQQIYHIPIADAGDEIILEDCIPNYTMSGARQGDDQAIFEYLQHRREVESNKPVEILGVTPSSEGIMYVVRLRNGKTERMSSQILIRTNGKLMVEFLESHIRFNSE